jgi:hypothetical protein
MAIQRIPRTATAGLHHAGPTPERRRHGVVERPERTIADSAGHPSRPYRAVDTLAIMQRRASITAGMRQAGEDFRARFALAQLDPLRALDLSRLRLGERSSRPDNDGPALRIEAARTAVWRAIQAVGGIASPAGSCLWHVLGWERSLKEWGARAVAGADAGSARNPRRAFSSPRSALWKRITAWRVDYHFSIHILTNPDRSALISSH